MARTRRILLFTRAAVRRGRRSAAPGTPVRPPGPVPKLTFALDRAAPAPQWGAEKLNLDQKIQIFTLG